MKDASMKLHEKHERTLLKTVTYRIGIIITQTIIVYFITRQPLETLSIVSVSNIVATCFYYLHERFWNSISYGKVVKK